MKTLAKAGFRDALNLERRLQSIVSYYWTLAAGLAYHSVNLSTKRAPVVGPILREMLDVVPAAWQPLFRRAAAACDALEA